MCRCVSAIGKRLLIQVIGKEKTDRLYIMIFHEPNGEKRMNDGIHQFQLMSGQGIASHRHTKRADHHDVGSQAVRAIFDKLASFMQRQNALELRKT
jgi:hypothetical protein